MFKYERKAYYHETDQMGIIHHSNYLKWMEEARIALMDKLGFSYKKMEDLGIISPVIFASCEYKKPIKFNDVVEIGITVEEYNGLKLTFNYEIVNKETKEVLTIGKTKHCFIKDGAIISLKRNLLEFHNAFIEFMEIK